VIDRSRRCALACIALAACAAQSGARLALPSSWDDRRLDAVLAGGRGRAVLAVLPFDAGTLGESDKLRIGDLVTTALVRSHRVDIVEREKLEKVLDEQRFRLTGAVDDASRAAEVGKLLGAEAVVFGAVTNATQETVDQFAFDLIRTHVRIDARAVDTTTGRVTFSESGEGTSEAKVVRDVRGKLISGVRDGSEEFRKAAAIATEALGRKMARLFPVVGVVVSPGPERIVIDLGAESGLGTGDELVAVRLGEVLVHPVTHQPMGRDKKVLDRLLVEAVEQQSATVSRRGLGDEPLRAGDIVVLSHEREER